MANVQELRLVEQNGKWVAIDKNGKIVESYPEKFTQKLREHGIMDVTYDAYKPFIGRNANEHAIVQKIAEELSRE